LWHEHDHQAGPGDQGPGQRRLVEERQQGEERYPGDAAEDVQPVRAQRPEADEDPGDTLAKTGHHGHREQENHGEADRLRQRLRLPDSQKLVGPGSGMQDDGEREDKRDERQQSQWRPAQVVPAGGRVQEPDPDPEEAGQEHKVGGLGHVHVVRRDPPDQRQLHEQHQEAGEGQPRLIPVLHPGPAAVVGPARAIGPGHIRAGHVRPLPSYPSHSRNESGRPPGAYPAPGRFSPARTSR
jgi:hypothetical protein